MHVSVCHGRGRLHRRRRARRRRCRCPARVLAALAGVDGVGHAAPLRGALVVEMREHAEAEVAERNRAVAMEGRDRTCRRDPDAPEPHLLPRLGDTGLVPVEFRVDLGDVVVEVRVFALHAVVRHAGHRARVVVAVRRTEPLVADPQVVADREPQTFTARAAANSPTTSRRGPWPTGVPAGARSSRDRSCRGAPPCVSSGRRPSCRAS